MTTLSKILIFTAIGIGYVYFSITYYLWHRERRGMITRFVDFFTHVRVEGVRFLIGLIFLSIGILLLQHESPIRAIGVFLVIVGYQVVLWAVGIESEYLGNVLPDDSESSDTTRTAGKDDAQSGK